jgi:hypothetical protein
MMKTTFLAAAVTLAAATMAQAGSTPVVSGVPVVITSSITIPTVSTDINLPVGGSIPVFFVVTPPTTPGGSFTFRLVRG